MDKIKILIVEDSMTQAMQLQYILELHGYDVTVAANGYDALKAIDAAKPVIVISDIVMPGIDGYELCQRIKAHPQHGDIWVVLLTALSQPQAVIWALQCGADKFLTKPYDEPQLLSTLETFHLNQYSEDPEEQEIITISYRGENYPIASSRRQILNLLLSTYETAIAKNQALTDAQTELKDLNRELEDRVLRRTKALQNEVAERKRTEESLLRERNMVARIMETNPAGIMAIHRDGKVGFTNKRAQEILGSMLNKINCLDSDCPEWPITDFEGNRLAGEDLVFCQVIASGSPVYGKRYALTDPEGRRVYLSINGAPLFDDAGNVSDVVLTIDDITEQRRSEEIIQDTLGKLRQSITKTARAMAMMVETRDPYTAGHQARVGALAEAIASEYGLPKDRIEGLRMASMIHDIGKISVPAEILVKPTRLSPIEFALIKVHAQAGYDILKDIDFPWPVARMVYEHHERIDGSGYPNGLAGDQILLESKILAVADVVESMAAHRPYRPALGIEVALGEITKNRGIAYDSGVVDACLRLFREKGYQL